MPESPRPSPPRAVACVLACGLLIAPGCYTRAIWTKGYPRTAEALPTAEGKRAEIESFAIVRGNFASDGWVRTADAGTTAPSEVVYTMSSFRPVIEDVSPSSRNSFSTLRTLSVWDAVFSGVTLAGVLLPLALRDDKTSEAVFWSGVGVGVLGGFGVDAVRRSVSNDIVEGYNRDLRRRIYGEGPLGSSSSNPDALRPAAAGSPHRLDVGPWWTLAPWPPRVTVGFAR